jgi:hypothetical protein
MASAVLKGKYLGGFTDGPKSATTLIVLNETGILIGGNLTQKFSVPWSMVSWLSVEGPEQLQGRITATRLVALGVFALAAKKTTKQAYLVAYLTTGDQVVFEFDETPVLVRQKFGPWLATHREPSPISQPSQGQSSTDAIAAPSAPMNHLASPAPQTQMQAHLDTSEASIPPMAIPSGTRDKASTDESLADKLSQARSETFSAIRDEEDAFKKYSERRFEKRSCMAAVHEINGRARPRLGLRPVDAAASARAVAAFTQVNQLFALEMRTYNLHERAAHSRMGIETQLLLAWGTDQKIRLVHLEGQSCNAALLQEIRDQISVRDQWIDKRISKMNEITALLQAMTKSQNAYTVAANTRGAAIKVRDWPTQRRAFAEAEATEAEYDNFEALARSCKVDTRGILDDAYSVSQEIERALTRAEEGMGSTNSSPVEDAASPASTWASEVASSSDLAGQLAQLAELHRSGELSDDEYAGAKQKLLG